MPGADDRDPVAEQRCGVPQGVDGGLDGPREHGARGRHAVGHDGHRAGRHDVGGLVRVQAEDRAAAQLRRSLLHGADVEVAVLDRPREVALLKWRPHRGVLVRRHTAPEHQRLGAPADAGPQGADHHVVRPWLGQRDRPDLPDAGRAQPERVRVGLHGPHVKTSPGEPDMPYMLFAGCGLWSARRSGLGRVTPAPTGGSACSCAGSAQVRDDSGRCWRRDCRAFEPRGGALRIGSLATDRHPLAVNWRSSSVGLRQRGPEGRRSATPKRLPRLTT